jgi:alanine racemase
VSLGDEVVLIGSQGDESVTVEEWAGVLDTIGYEVLTGIGARVPRVVTDDGAPVGQTARGER